MASFMLRICKTDEAARDRLPKEDFSPYLFRGHCPLHFENICNVDVASTVQCTSLIQPAALASCVRRACCCQCVVVRS